MAAIPKINRDDLLEAQERYGVVRRLVRRVRVIQLTSTDYQVLSAALTALGITPGSGLTGAAFANLVLTERNPKIVDVSTVDVDLIYEHALNTGQSMVDPFFGLLIGEVSASLNQVETNLDHNGSPIILYHRFPKEDDPLYSGKQIPQGGRVEIYEPQATIRFQTVREGAYPWLFQRYVLGSVNAFAWSGRAEGEWLCTDAAFKLLDGPNNKYEFSCAFQAKLGGWDPTAVFIDPRTGRPPHDLIEGVGYKVIRKYPRVDFENAFGVRSQGG